MTHQQQQHIEQSKQMKPELLTKSSLKIQYLPLHCCSKASFVRDEINISRLVIKMEMKLGKIYGAWSPLLRRTLRCVENQRSRREKRNEKRKRLWRMRLGGLQQLRGNGPFRWIWTLLKSPTNNQATNICCY